MASNTEKPNRLSKPGIESEARAVVPIAAKAAAELSGIPYLGALVGSLADLVKEHIGRTRQAMQHEGEQRLTTFFSTMLKADATMDEEVARAMVDDADFHALLRACVADIESEKVGAYAALARGIAAGTVDKKWRRHFILSLRDFSNEELECLRGAYVAKGNDIIPAQGTTMGEGHYLRVGQPGSRQAILMNNLSLRGFVHDGKLSPVGEAFTKACWRAEQLTPGALGHRTWSGHNIAIVNYEIGSGGLDELAMKLQDALRVAGAKSSILAVVRTNEQQARLLFTMAIVLTGNASKHLQENMSHLTNLAAKVPTMLVQTGPGAVQLSEIPVFGEVTASNREHSEVVKEICAMVIQKSSAANPSRP